MRKLTLEQARAAYVHRYTGEHKPRWAHETLEKEGRTVHYAPQYLTDSEWYACTVFPGEPGHYPHSRKDTSCRSGNPSWPLGQWLEQPYTPRRIVSRSLAV